MPREDIVIGLDIGTTSIQVAVGLKKRCKKRPR